MRDNRPLFEREIGALYQKFYAELEIASEVDHPGEKGGRIEQVVAALLRKILPTKYEVKTNQFLVDCTGKVSRECDIVILDRTTHFDFFYNYVPIELCYGVIEVKKNLGKKEADDFKRKFVDFRKLNYRGQFTNWGETRLREQKTHIAPPSFSIFSMSSRAIEFERFVAWTSTQAYCQDRFVPEGAYDPGLTHSISVAASLDFGITRNDNPIHLSMCAISDDPTSDEFQKKVGGKSVNVSGKKSLMFFLMQLEAVLSMKAIVPYFDNRAYLNYCLGLSTYLPADEDLLIKYFGEAKGE